MEYGCVDCGRGPCRIIVTGTREPEFCIYELARGCDWEEIKRERRRMTELEKELLEALDDCVTEIQILISAYGKPTPKDALLAYEKGKAVITKAESAEE